MDFPRVPSFLTLSLVTTSKPSADSERPKARDWRRAPELVLTDSRSRPRARSGTGDCTGLAPVQRVGFSDGRHSAAPAGRPPHVGLWLQAGDRKGARPEWCPPPPPRIAVVTRVTTPTGGQTGVPSRGMLNELTPVALPVQAPESRREKLPSGAVMPASAERTCSRASTGRRQP